MTTPFLGAAAVLCVIAALNVAAQDRTRPAGWDDVSHGPRTAPDYQRVFAVDRVHELRIVIPPDRFLAMQEDLKTVMPGGFGAPGGGGPFAGPGRFGGAGERDGGPGDLPAFTKAIEEATATFTRMMEEGTAACKQLKAGAACTANGMAGQCNALPFADGLVCMPEGFGGRGGAAPNLTSRDPMYVPVSVTYDGRTWTQVGMRYKGNSSLMMANVSGNGKIPFRLDFDRYEDQTPAIRDQRFHGFQKLTFSSNLGDDSQIRELLAAEVFRDRGVPAARAAFYRVFIDTGAGPEYWGLYTMLEDPADGAMLQAQFGSRDGNLYKPEGPGADWSLFDPKGFGKKTNEAAANFSDVELAIEALHAPRTTPAAWRRELERRFDVDLFLRWLAVNTAIENWDSYGVFAHNYYVYGDPARQGQLRWIPWDHNFSFGASPFAVGPVGRGFGGRGFPAGLPGGGPPAAGGPMPPGGLPIFGPGNADVLHRNVGHAWPLIQRLLADDVYAARYRTALDHASSGLLAADALERRARALHALVTPAVVGERGERPSHSTITSADGFARALEGPEGLLARARARQALVRSTLAATARQ